MRSRWPARRGLAVAGLVFVVAVAALTILRHDSTPRYRLSAGSAIAAARSDPFDARFLARHATTRAATLPLDDRLQRVTFFDGPRVVLDAAVDPNGAVRAREEHLPGVAPWGAREANRLWLLALLTALFLGSVMVAPLWRIRNLDAAVIAGFTANIVLVNDRLVSASVVASVPLLGYLAVRCLRVGTRSRAPTAARSQTPLFEWLTPAWDDSRRLRMLRLVAGALLAAFLAITLTSSGESDVAAASVSGATDLLHGQLPYGHIIGGVVHGDTYPLLNYVLYVPGALWMPVTDVWSDLSGALPVSAAGALAVGLALRRIARSVAGPDHATATRAALCWLAFPPVLVAASAGSNDLVVAACLAWMLALAADASRSTLLLVAAVWTKLAPLILVPLWLARPERRQGLTLLPAVLLSLLLCAYLIALGGPGAFGKMISGLSFQFQRGSFYSPWYSLSVPWLQPVAEATVVAALAWAVLRIRRQDAGVWGDPVRIAGICGAVLLGLQLSANYWTYSYLTWAFPFVAGALLLELPSRDGAGRRVSAVSGPLGGLRGRRRSHARHEYRLEPERDPAD